jgi:hypothetical protein
VDILKDSTTDLSCSVDEKTKELEKEGEGVMTGDVASGRTFMTTDEVPLSIDFASECGTEMMIAATVVAIMVGMGTEPETVAICITEDFTIDDTTAPTASELRLLANKPTVSLILPSLTGKLEITLPELNLTVLKADDLWEILVTKISPELLSLIS